MPYAAGLAPHRGQFRGHQSGGGAGRSAATRLLLGSLPWLRPGRGRARPRRGAVPRPGRGLRAASSTPSAVARWPWCPVFRSSTRSSRSTPLDEWWARRSGRTLRAVQTPQGFRRDVLERAHAESSEATDDAGLVERLGETVLVVEGDPRALKVTTPADLEAAARILAG